MGLRARKNALKEVTAGVDQTDFRILGPLEAVVGGRPVALGGRKQRALLALLLVRAGTVVSADELIEEVWGAEAPATVRAGLHVYLSRLRRLIGANGELVRHPHGYSLVLTDGQLDAERFEKLAREGREALRVGDAARATETLSRALALWRGPALADLADEAFTQGAVHRLEDLRLRTIEDRIDADLHLGRSADVAPELEMLIELHPYRERLRGQLMLALYHLGRQADALEAYRAAREGLSEELGLEPGQELKRLEQAILSQDDAVGAPARSARFGPLSRERPSRDGRLSAYLGAGAAAIVVAFAAVALTMRSDGDVGGGIPVNAVGAIDPATNRVVAAIAVGAQPAGLAAGAGSLWAANAVDGTVSRVDLDTRRTVRTLPVGGTPASVTASSSAVWVATGERMARIDPRFDTIVKTLGTGRLSSWARASVPSARSGRTVWVADGYGIAQIDERTNSVVRRVETGDSPSAITTYGRDVWVADNVDDTVTRVEPTNAATVVPVGSEPNGIAVGRNAIWVAVSGDDALARIDPVAATVVTTIPVGRRPTSVLYAAGFIWVANSGDGTISRVDPDENRVVATAVVGGRPQGLAFADGLLWVANRGTRSELPSEVAKRGGTARFVGHADIDAFPEGLSSLDPAVSFNSDVWKLFYATCAKLLDYPDARAPAGSQLRPDVAAAMPSISADRRSYTFTIRSGHRF